MDQYAIACMTNAELIYWNSFEFLSLNLFLYDHLLIAHFFCYPFLPLVCQIWTWICLWCGGWLYSLSNQNWNEKWVLLCHSQKEDNCHLWDSRCYWSWTQQTQPNHHLKRNKDLLKHLWNIIWGPLTFQFSWKVHVWRMCTHVRVQNEMSVFYRVFDMRNQAKPWKILKDFTRI